MNTMLKKLTLILFFISCGSFSKKNINKEEFTKIYNEHKNQSNFYVNGEEIKGINYDKNRHILNYWKGDKSKSIHLYNYDVGYIKFEKEKKGKIVITKSKQKIKSDIINSEKFLGTLINKCDSETSKLDINKNNIFSYASILRYNATGIPFTDSAIHKDCTGSLFRKNKIDKEISFIIDNIDHENKCSHLSEDKLYDLLYDYSNQNKPTEIKEILKLGIELNKLILKKYKNSFIKFYRYVDIEMIKTLINYGLNIDLQDSCGDTLLIDAIFRNISYLPKWLLNQGANPIIYNNEDKSVLYYAYMKCNLELIKLLQNSYNISLSENELKELNKLNKIKEIYKNAFENKNEKLIQYYWSNGVLPNQKIITDLLKSSRKKDKIDYEKVNLLLKYGGRNISSYIDTIDKSYSPEVFKFLCMKALKDEILGFKSIVFVYVYRFEKNTNIYVPICCKNIIKNYLGKTIKHIDQELRELARSKLKSTRQNYQLTMLLTSLIINTEPKKLYKTLFNNDVKDEFNEYLYEETSEENEESS